MCYKFWRNIARLRVKRKKRMPSIIKTCLASLLALLLCVGDAWAEQPDPVEFSWAVERGDIGKVTSWLDAGLSPEFMGSEIGSGLMIAA